MGYDDYYEKMESLWAKKYPSVSSVEEVEAFYKECGMENPLNELVKRFIENPKLKFRNNRLLDFGCDNGIMLNWFKGFGLELYGVDINDDSIAKGEVLFPEFILAQSEWVEIPYEDDYFDIVFASAVLKHIRYKDRKELYNEFARVARYILVWEKNSDQKRVEKMEGFNFYNSNFKTELARNFDQLDLVEIGDDIYGLYEVKAENR
ncbi:MAG: class I SAM-dependent methyltransferase [SAR324 cluster bacterium]|nr:class I SAM-dependent methyltransferase [SAR324 cluster bacterium]